MCQTGLQEADLVARKVQELRRSGTALRDVAVLFRKRMASRRLEAVLEAQHIPLRIVGGKRLTDAAHAAGATERKGHAGHL